MFLLHPRRCKISSINSIIASGIISYHTRSTDSKLHQDGDDEILRNVTARITQITRQLDGTGWQSDSQSGSHHLLSAFLICRAVSVIRVNCYLAKHLKTSQGTTNSKQPAICDFKQTSWKHQPSFCGWIVIRHFSKKRPFLEVAAWEHGTLPGLEFRFTWNSSWYLVVLRRVNHIFDSIVIFWWFLL